MNFQGVDYLKKKAAELEVNNEVIFEHDGKIHQVFERSDGDYELNEFLVEGFDPMEENEPVDGGVITSKSALDVIRMITGELEPEAWEKNVSPTEIFRALKIMGATGQTAALDLTVELNSGVKSGVIVQEYTDGTYGYNRSSVLSTGLTSPQLAQELYSGVALIQPSSNICEMEKQVWAMVDLINEPSLDHGDSDEEMVM